MICVSIGRGRHRHVIAEHQHLVQQGTKLVEIRVDYLAGKVNLKRLLENRPCPAIFTCRREKDGGKYSGSEEDRILLLRTAVAQGVDYIDIEEDIAEQIPRFGNTKRIISYHDFRSTPESLDLLHRRMSKLDPDVIKIATMAHNPLDNFRMFRLSQDSSIPTVAICMGEMGTVSRILAGKFGAPFTYATFHHERALAPGQLSYRQMVDHFHYDDINAETEVFGVIADPVGHSLSPLIHNGVFRHLEMNRVYVPLRIPKESLDAFLEQAEQWGFRGLSVTIPHKQSVLRYCSHIDDNTRGIGAANTLVFGRSGGIQGYNTDCAAAMDSLAQVLGKEKSSPEIEGKTAILLGAGGVARAIGYGLRERGVEVVIASRTYDRAAQLAEKLGGKAVEWRHRTAQGAHIVVNCTPIGMHPNVDESPIERHYLKPSMTVFDTVYNPESTLLIKYAREQSCRVATGVDMFVRQAAMQFERFTGQEADLKQMRDILRRAIGPAKY